MLHCSYPQFGCIKSLISNNARWFKPTSVTSHEIMWYDHRKDFSYRSIFVQNTFRPFKEDHLISRKFHPLSMSINKKNLQSYQLHHWTLWVQCGVLPCRVSIAGLYARGRRRRCRARTCDRQWCAGGTHNAARSARAPPEPRLSAAMSWAQCRTCKANNEWVSKFAIGYSKR